MGKKGFSVIELLVTIAILSILVLISTSRHTGQIEKANLVRIQHEIKLMENDMFNTLENNKRSYEEWDYNGKDLADLVYEQELFGIVGILDESSADDVKLIQDEAIVINHEKLELGTGGLLYLLSGDSESGDSEEEVKVDTKHRIIPDEVKEIAGVNLDGVFYSNEDGRVYYEMGEPKPIPPVAIETPEPVAPDTMFIGESDLISYDGITELVGLENSGRKIKHYEEMWLKFRYNGNIQYVAKRPIRAQISYNEIKDRKLIYGNDGDTVITIDGKRYKVRLMKTLNDDVEGLGSKIDEKRNYELFHNSEYNQLMLPIHEKSINEKWEMSEYIGKDVPVWNHDYGSSPSGLYTDEDLHTDEAFNMGTSSWMQEFGSSYKSFLDRGYTGIETVDEKNGNNSGAHRGWRPVLELIDE